MDGHEEDFPFATDAVNRGPVFTVRRYFPEQRRLEEVQSFLTVDVAFALVQELHFVRYVAGSVPER